MKKVKYTRRDAIKLGSLASTGLVLPINMSFDTTDRMIKRTISKTGESLPIVGLGTWQTFDVSSSSAQLKILKEVLQKMHHHGGRIIDSSPMYGNSEKIVGNLTKELNYQKQFFYATKVWTSGKESGKRQIKSSMIKMRRKKMDLIQIHNLLDWETHVKTLKGWKEEGKIRYWGITHYVDSSHETLKKVIQSEKPDFVQFNYSIRSRNAEKFLFKTAKDNNTAVIINQPFESGSLFRLVRNKELPEWCKEYYINSWAQYFLKFVLSHQTVTCVIPGTSKPRHVIDNMKAGYGKMPDRRTREKMFNYLKKL